MVNFPNAKINLSLNIIEKRADGFHNIESVFYPLNWCDALEIIENKNYSTGSEKCDLEISGIEIPGDLKDNLIRKAYDLLSLKRELPPLQVHLHKIIPMGAGLGGGSSDAAFFIKLVNLQFQLNITPEEQKAVAARLGSDCAFFIENKPVFASGKGDQFEHIAVALTGYRIVVVYPGIHSNTALAYSRVVPKQPEHDLKDILWNRPIGQWKECLKNDFEESVFSHFPEIRELKELLYKKGAIYASLSGSGSSVFGLFPTDKQTSLKFPANYKIYECVAT